MASLGELTTDGNLKDKAYYKILSLVSGQDLAETERQKLRQNRKQIIESYSDVTHISEDAMEIIIDLGLKESELIDGFEPDLLIVSKPQYHKLFDIPASVGIGAQHIPMSGTHSTQPPLPYETDAGTIQVTYSSSTQNMLLVESATLD